MTHARGMPAIVPDAAISIGAERERLAAIRAKIGRAKERYRAWCDRRYPGGASHEEWMAWHYWKQARINYFNEQLEEYSWRKHKR